MTHTRGIKLTRQQWREARELHANGIAINVIAKRFGCAYSTAWSAIRRTAPPADETGTEPEVCFLNRVDAYLRTQAGTEEALRRVAACLE